jgi:uncharacterized protein (TIGR00369 family)
VTETSMPFSQLQEILKGSPYHRLFSMDLVQTEAEDELQVRVQYTSAVERVPGGGQYHGGVLASLGDIAGTFVLLRALGIGASTIHFSIDFMRPAVKTDVVAHAKVRRLGKTVGFVDIDIQNESGQLVAVCRGVYALMR